MPSPKSGTAGVLVPPAAPDEAKDADDADPGQVEQVKAGQRQQKSGKYGSTPVTPFKPNDASSEVRTSWIEIELRDKRKNPIAGARYKVKLPDGSVADGTLDGDGMARLSGIDPETCQITFPEYAPNSWDRA